MSSYYTPSIEEFRIGFAYEFKDGGEWIRLKWNADVTIIGRLLESIVRVKYLDRSDIENCGFTYTDECTISNRDCYKLLPDKTIYQISPYFNFRHEERENLVRIYKGELHNYPYQEIFRGDIKNLSELHQVLDMIGVEYER